MTQNCLLENMKITNVLNFSETMEAGDFSHQVVLINQVIVSFVALQSLNMNKTITTCTDTNN